MNIYICYRTFYVYALYKKTALSVQFWFCAHWPKLLCRFCHHLEITSQNFISHFWKSLRYFLFSKIRKNALTEHVKLFYLDKKKTWKCKLYWLYTRVKFPYMLLRGSALRYYKWLINFLLIMKLKVRKNTKIPRFALGKTHYSLIMKLVYVSWSTPQSAICVQSAALHPCKLNPLDIKNY